MIDDLSKVKLCVIGLGYVGLPIAIEFGKIVPTIGFDINEKRIKDLSAGIDQTLEIEKEDMENSPHLSFTSDSDSLKICNVFIITVPTPIDSKQQPDLGPLLSASKLVGSLIKKNSIVIYESTVYPGATEDECVPVLEIESGLKFNDDFFVGYSPERINPGDKEHGITSIVKVTSGSTPESADFIDSLYRSIVDAGTYRAESIKVAEAAKVIENTQRDLNIALINELAIIFNKLDIDTEQVLQAAGTKWNFLPFRPGLVGGHCIGVDPYYLTHKSESIGYVPEVILAGRRINDGMGKHVAHRVIEELKNKKLKVEGAKVLVMGLTFKENCPDIRNTKVVDILSELEENGLSPEVYDPWVNKSDMDGIVDFPLIKVPRSSYYDVIILAVAHSEFQAMKVDDFRALLKQSGIIYDLKYIMPKSDSDIRL